MYTQQKLTHTLPCPMRLLAVLVLGSLSLHAGAQESVPPKAQPIVTAPAVNSVGPAPSVTPATAVPTPTLTGTPVSSTLAEGARPPSTAPAEPTEEGNVPWVLKPEQHPWPIHFKDAATLSPLMLDIPTEGEAKMMLPGSMGNALDSARAEGVKYINTSLSNASQVSGRNGELLNDWIIRTTNQSKTLNNDPWQAYQFWREARQELLKFRKGVSGQSTGSIERMTLDVKNAIEKITPVMHASSAQEYRMGWYNVLVQLRDGFNQFQTQVQNDDQKLLARVDEFLQANPDVAKPDGPIPRKDGKYVPKTVETATPTTPAAAPEAHVPSKPVNLQEQNNLGGILTIGGVLFLAGFFFYRAKDRFLPKKGKGSNPVEPK